MVSHFAKVHIVNDMAKKQATFFLQKNVAIVYVLFF